MAALTEATENGQITRDDIESKLRDLQRRGRRRRQRQQGLRARRGRGRPGRRRRRRLPVSVGARGRSGRPSSRSAGSDARLPPPPSHAARPARRVPALDAVWVLLLVGTPWPAPVRRGQGEVCSPHEIKPGDTLVIAGDGVEPQDLRRTLTDLSAVQVTLRNPRRPWRSSGPVPRVGAARERLEHQPRVGPRDPQRHPRPRRRRCSTTPTRSRSAP